MSDQIYFTRWLAAVGVIGGVAIALVLPYLVLVHGQYLGPRAQILLVVLAILAGILLAGVSAVVGIAVPHRVTGAAFRVNCGDSPADPGSTHLVNCCPPEKNSP